MPLDGAKVRARRERLELTQAEAAERAQMPRPNWARMEAGGHSDAKLSTAERVADALQCALSSLLAERRGER